MSDSSRNRNRRPSHAHSEVHEGGKRPQKKRRKKKKRSSVFKVIVAVCMIIGFAIVGAGLGAVFGILQNTEALQVADVLPGSYTSIIYDQDGNEFDKLYWDENREYVPLEEIPLHLQQAAIAIEDERFYEHGGIDIRGIFRAMVKNISTWEFNQGASTITQQLIKNEALTGEKKLERKIKEQYLAIQLENTLEDQLGSKKAAKDYILELYLNTIGLSHGLNGVESAAQYYFGKHVSELTLAESACIVSITNNPSLYAPDTNPEENKKRQTLVLDKMLELEYITQEEHDAALAEDIYSNLVCQQTQEENQTAKHNYFVEALINQVAEDLQNKKGYTKTQAYNLIYSGGLEIHSTMDPEMQSIMEDVFMDDSFFPPNEKSYDVVYLISVLDTETEQQQHYERTTTISSADDQEAIDAFINSVKEEVLDETHTLVLDSLTVSNSLQAAMVIMDQSNGQVKALVGGRGEKPGDSVFNRATQALRQPGSCFKILAAYAPAFDTGLLMPGSVVVDEPYTVGSKTFNNWWGARYNGPSTAREGIKFSMNILAVKVYMMLGASVVDEYLHNFGFTSIVEEDKNAATALGGLTDGVSVLELTAAYAAIANGGVYNEPIYYTVIYNHEGEVLLDQSTQDTHRVLKETTAYLLTDAMEDVITGSSSTQGNMKSIGITGALANFSGMHIAGKTGTTTDDKDLTFAGYTPYYTAGIWMGHDTPKRISYDKSYHLLIWKEVMSRIHEELPDKEFTKPSGIVSQTYCSATGGIPTDLCAQDYYGLTTHTDIAASDNPGLGGACEAHKVFTICTESGMLASENCPEDCREDVVLAVDENGKILSKPNSIPEGKLDIDISKTCTAEHEAPGTEIGNGYEPGVPIDPTNPTDPNAPSGEGNQEIPEGVLPSDETGFGW